MRVNPLRGLETLPRAHACCLLLIVVELAAGALLHQTPERLWERWEGGSVQERIDALHALAHRAEGTRIDTDLVADLVRESDQRLRAMTMTVAVTKHGARHVQAQQMRSLRSSNVQEWCRLYLILTRRPGSNVLRREELDWFLNSLEGSSEVCPALRQPSGGGDAPPRIGGAER